jgi:hypothetical protein
MAQVPARRPPTQPGNVEFWTEDRLKNFKTAAKIMMVADVVGLGGVVGALIYIHKKNKENT